MTGGHLASSAGSYTLAPIAFVKETRHFLWISFISPVGDLLEEHVWAPFWGFSSVPLIFLSVSVSASECFDDHYTVVGLEVWKFDSSSFNFILQDSFGHYFVFLVEFFIFFSSTENVVWFIKIPTTHFLNVSYLLVFI